MDNPKYTFLDENTLQVEAVSPASGLKRTRTFVVSRSQFNRWMSGTIIQIAMPHLSSSEREFIMTGMTDIEWDTTFKNEEE